MPASDHSEPVNIQDAPVLSRTVSDRAKVFRIAKSMVKKRVPNHQALQTDALNHLEQCLDKETRQARSQLERTLEDYLGWCSEWDLPCLPVFSLVAALHIYDGSVSAHNKSELSAKDVRCRRRWLANLSWIAERANPYFSAINAHKAGADFIGPLLLGDAVQEVTQMNADGQYWEDQLEPQPASPEASTSKACSPAPQPTLIVKPTPVPSSKVKNGKAKGKARVVPSDSETPSSDEDEDDDAPLRKRELGSSSRTPPTTTQSSPPVDPALAYISPEKSQNSDSPVPTTQDPRKRLAPDVPMPSFKRKKQVHTSKADPRLLFKKKADTSQTHPKSASTSSPAPRVDIADLAAKRKEHQRQRQRNEQEATDADEGGSLERREKAKQEEAEQRRQQEDHRKRREREAEQQRAKEEQEVQARKQAEQEAEAREKEAQMARQRAEAEQRARDEHEHEHELQAEHQRSEAEAEALRTKQLEAEKLLAQKRTAEQQKDTDQGKRVDDASRQTAGVAPQSEPPAEYSKQASKSTSPYVLAPASSSSNAAPPAPAVQPVDNSTSSALTSSASASGLTSAAPQGPGQAAERSPLEPGQIEDDDDAIEIIGVTPALGSKPGVPKLPPHPNQFDSSWGTISNRTLQRALSGLPARHRNLVSDSGFRHLFHDLPPSVAATATHKRKASPDASQGSADQPTKEPRLTIAPSPSSQTSTNGQSDNPREGNTIRRPELSVSTAYHSSPIVASTSPPYVTDGGPSRPASALPRLEPSQAVSQTNTGDLLPPRPLSAASSQQQDRQRRDAIGKASATAGQRPPLLEVAFPPNLVPVADPKVAEILRRGPDPTGVPCGQPASPGIALPRLPVRGAYFHAFGRGSIASEPLVEHPVLPVVNPAPVPQAMSLTLSKPPSPVLHIRTPLYSKVITDPAESMPCVCNSCVKRMRRFLEARKKNIKGAPLPGSQPLRSAGQPHQEPAAVTNTHTPPIPVSVPPRPSSAPLDPQSKQRSAGVGRPRHAGPPSQEASSSTAGVSFLSRSSGAGAPTAPKPSSADVGPSVASRVRPTSGQHQTSHASAPSQATSTHLVAGPEPMTMPPPFGKPAADRSRIPPLNVIAGVAWYHVYGMEPPYDYAPQEALPDDVAKLRNDFEGTLHIASHNDYFGPILATYFIALNEEVFTSELRRRAGEVLWAKINQHQYPGAMRDLIGQLNRLSGRLVDHSAGWLCQCLRQKHADVEHLYLLFRYGSMGFFKSVVNKFPLPLFASALRPPGPGQPEMVPPSAVPNTGAGGSNSNSTMVSNAGASFTAAEVRHLLQLQHSRLQELFRVSGGGGNVAPAAISTLPPQPQPQPQPQAMQYLSPFQNQQQQQQRPTQYASPAQLSMSNGPPGQPLGAPQPLRGSSSGAPLPWSSTVNMVHAVQPLRQPF